MNRKQLTTLAILAAVIGGIGFVLFQKRQESWSSGGPGIGQKVIADFPLNDISEVTIQDVSNRVTLAKAEGQWKVKSRANYPANFEDIGDLIYKVWDLKSKQKPKVGPSNYGRLNLLDPGEVAEGETDKAATEVVFKDASGQAVATLMLGKEYIKQSGGNSPMGGSFPEGRYVMAKGDPNSLSLVSETFSDIQARADDWLLKDFFKVERLKSIDYQSPEKTHSWKLVRDSDTADWKLAKPAAGEALDSGKVGSLKSLFSFPSFTDVIPPETKPAEAGLGNPVVATLETFDGFTYTVKIGQADEDENYPLQLDVKADLPEQRTAEKDEKEEDKERLDKEFQDKQAELKKKLNKEKVFTKWIYRVSKWTVDPLLKDRGELLKEKEAEEAKADPGKALGSDLLKNITQPAVVPPTPKAEPEAEAKGEKQAAPEAKKVPEAQPAPPEKPAPKPE